MILKTHLSHHTTLDFRWYTGGQIRTRPLIKNLNWTIGTMRRKAVWRDRVNGRTCWKVTIRLGDDYHVTEITSVTFVRFFTSWAFWQSPGCSSWSDRRREFHFILPRYFVCGCISVILTETLRMNNRLRERIDKAFVNKPLEVAITLTFQVQIRSLIGSNTFHDTRGISMSSPRLPKWTD